MKGLEISVTNEVEVAFNFLPKDIKIIGISGSNGKTTTKEIAISIFKQEFNVIATKGNFNSETGLPLSVFNIRKEHEVGIFEMSAKGFDCK